jgi:hypothetical protein
MGKMATPLLPLVSDELEARNNIETYNKALEELDPDQYGKRAIARMIPYVRAWYAMSDARGQLMFAPSKFIGYSAISADLYEHYEQLDGRVTESRLAKWAEPITPADPRYGQFQRELSLFCARFGGHPNGRARLGFFRSAQAVGASLLNGLPENGDDEHIKAVLAIIARMPLEARERVRRGVSQMSSRQS